MDILTEQNIWYLFKQASYDELLTLHYMTEMATRWKKDQKDQEISKRVYEVVNKYTELSYEQPLNQLQATNAQSSDNDSFLTRRGGRELMIELLAKVGINPKEVIKDGTEAVIPLPEVTV